MENFRDKDQQFVADWLVQQGLGKLVDVFKGMFLNFNVYSNLKSHKFKANSESVNKLWRFSQHAAFDSFYMVFNKIPAFGNINSLQI